MKFKTYTGITWSVLELTGLLEDDDSHVYLEKFKKHLGLHPFHLTNLTAALNEILSSNLNFYDTDLKGFLLAYKNPKLLTPLGEIFYDTCFIHVDIEADFYVFRPEVGYSLKGIINKKGLGHIGVLVHKAFNVSIPKPENEDNWVGDNLETGQEVRFTITSLDFTSKLPFIRGVLDPDTYLQGCKLIETTVNACNISSDISVQHSDDNTNHSTSRKKSKCVKRQKLYSIDSQDTSVEDNSEANQKGVKCKKLNTEFEQQITKHTGKEKKDRKHAKKTKGFEEAKPLLVNTEICMSIEHTNGKFTDDEELEKSNGLKSKFKKKSKSGTSYSYKNEDINKKLGKCLSQDESRKLLEVESKDAINKTMLKQNRISNNLVQITEENTFENKVKVEDNTKKRKNSSDYSMDEFTSYKYIKNSFDSSKRNSKSFIIKNEKISTNIKMEKLNDTDDVSSETDKTFNKKQIKKCLQYAELETSETEKSGNLEERINKNDRISDSDFTFQNIKIKTEKVTSDSENTQSEGYVKVNQIFKRDTDSNVSMSSLNDILETEHSDHTKKKHKRHSKNKIKIKSEFETIVPKVRELDDCI